MAVKKPAAKKAPKKPVMKKAAGRDLESLEKKIGKVPKFFKELTTKEPEMFNLVPLQSLGFALRMDPALGQEPVELWLAPCSDLGAAVQLEPDENGAYHPCPLTPDDLHVLYATVKGEDDELYKKYIWLVGFSDL